MISAKYTHTNLIARDWRKLADFYIHVLGCQFVPPERDLSGEGIAKSTAVPGAHLRGAHLRLPGHGDAGPTLEIFQYEPQAAEVPPAINRPGFGHLAFAVPDVPAALAEFIAAGGSTLGEVVSQPVAGAGVVTFVYAADPEGNYIELQSWSK